MERGVIGGIAEWPRLPTCEPGAYRLFVTPLTAMIRTGARDCPRTAVQPAPAVMLLGKLLTQRSQVQILPPQQAKGQVTGGAGRPAPPLFGPIALVAKDQSRDRLCRLRLERRIAWLWTSIVNATVAWPNRSETTLGCTQAASASVACIWRRSWNRIRGSPGLRTRRSNPCETVSGCAGRPYGVYENLSGPAVTVADAVKIARLVSTPA